MLSRTSCSQGNPTISRRNRSTRAKIQKILKKHNFERNVLASTLAYRKKYNIAVLVPSYKSNRDFWFEPDKGIKSAVKEIKKYGVVVHNYYFDKLDRNSFIRALTEIIELNPDGVVFGPFFFTTSLGFAAELDRRHIPFLCINIDIDSQQKLTFIGQDAYSGGYMAGKLLNLVLDCPHQIAIAKSRNVDNHHAIEARIKGFSAYFAQNGITRKIREIFVHQFNWEETNKVLARELKGSQIKGIFVPTSMSFHVARYLENNHLSSVHLVGFDAHANNLKYLRSGTIDFLIDQDPLEQGYMGVKVMFEYLLFKKRPNKIYPSAINIVTQENSEFFRNPKAAEIVT
jgi:LacI family transcriptional regulator